MQKKKVALIGSTSFLVSHLAPLFSSASFELHFFGRKKNNNFPNEAFYLFDYPNTSLDFSILDKMDIIVFASSLGVQYGVVDPKDWMYEVNTFLPSRLLLHLDKVGFKGTVFTFGSYAEIGKNNLENTAFTEEDLVKSTFPGSNEYGGSKRMLSSFIFNNHFNFSNYHLILPTIYGEGENENRLIPYLINGIKNKKEMILTAGEQTRQYIYIGDMVQVIFEMLSTLPPSGIYNAPAVNTLTIKEVIDKVFSHLNGDRKLINTNSGRNDVAMKALILDSSKLSKVVKYQWKVTIEQAIEKYNF